MPENTRSTNHTYNEGMYSGVPGSGRSQTENTRSSELEKEVTELIRVYLEGLHNPRSDRLYNELRAERDTKNLKQAIEALIASKVEEAQSKAVDDIISMMEWLHDGTTKERKAKIVAVRKALQARERIIHGGTGTKNISEEANKNLGG